MSLHLRMSIFALALALLSAPAWAANCTPDDFGKAVDEAGAELRAFNLENAPKLQAKIRQLKAKKGWSDDDEMAHDYLSDVRLSNFDATANELLAKIDALGQTPSDKALDCSKLDELRAATLELLAVMRAKSGYIIAKIDTELAAKPSETAAAPSPSSIPRPAVPAPSEPAETPSAATAPTAPVTPGPQKGQPVAPPKVAAAPTQPAPKAAETAKKPPSTPWSTTTEPHSEVATIGVPPPPPPAAPSGAFVPPEDGYSIEEIRDATRGFFGTASTNLAAVLEHSFGAVGRPTAYVLGQEGGGAFLAGLRYGSGTLYLRSGGTTPIYWHGPSLGYDVGAAGSRTLFLIYGLKKPQDLLRHFTGVDGSAYVIGGVGMTLLKGGDIVMAPVRTGLGLRVGANIGYVRFTQQPSWNPF